MNIPMTSTSGELSDSKKPTNQAVATPRSEVAMIEESRETEGGLQVDIGEEATSIDEEIAVCLATLAVIIKPGATEVGGEAGVLVTIGGTGAVIGTDLHQGKTETKDLGIDKI